MISAGKGEGYDRNASRDVTERGHVAFVQINIDASVVYCHFTYRVVAVSRTSQNQNYCVFWMFSVQSIYQREEVAPDNFRFMSVYSIHSQSNEILIVDTHPYRRSVTGKH